MPCWPYTKCSPCPSTPFTLSLASLHLSTTDYKRKENPVLVGIGQGPGTHGRLVCVPSCSPWDLGVTWKRSRQLDTRFRPSPVCDVCLCLEQVLLVSSQSPPHKLNPLSQSALLCCCLLSSFWRTGLPVLFLNRHSLDTCLSRHRAHVNGKHPT